MTIQSLAVVSGKGGSGKTLIVTALAQVFALAGKRVLMVDADLGTGGLTYFLGFSVFERARDGLVEVLDGKHSISKTVVKPRAESIQSSEWLSEVELLPIGNHNDLNRNEHIIKSENIRKIISDSEGSYDVVIFDCRGGVDIDSVKVCGAVENILIVAETDAASIQATQHLSTILYSADLGQRIVGFALNKVMDDPTALAQAGRTFFKCEYLGSVPLDIETTRNFIRGEVPNKRSLFSRHVESIAHKIIDLGDITKGRTLRPSEFGDTATRGPILRFGRFIWLFMFAYLSVVFFFFAQQNISGFNTDFERGAISTKYLPVIGVWGLLLIVGLLSDRLMEAFGLSLRKIATRLLEVTRRIF